MSSTRKPALPEKPDSTAWKIITGLSKVSIALKSHSWKEANESGLTPTQGQILVNLNLWSSKNPGLSELAEALGITLATASSSMNTLVEKKLVRKSRSPVDGRSLVVSLTAKGKKEAENAAGWPDFLTGAIEVLSPEEQAVFFRGLLKIIRSLQDEGQIPVSRMCVTCAYFKPHVHKDLKRPHHCGFVNSPFGDGELRLECGDHESASSVESDRIWEIFFSDKKKF